MQLVEAVRPLHHASRIVGMAPFLCSRAGRLRQSCVATLYSYIVLVFVIISSTFNTLRFIKIARCILSDTSLFCEISATVLAYMTACVCLLASILSSRRNAQRFLYLIEKVDARMRIVLRMTTSYKTFKHKVLAVVSVFAVLVLVPVTRALAVNVGYFGDFDVLVYAVSGICVLQYGTMVLLLREKLRDVNSCLSQYENRLRSTQHVRDPPDVPFPEHTAVSMIVADASCYGDLRSLKSLRHVRGVLCEVAANINSSYSVQISSVVVASFCNLLVDLYLFIGCIIYHDLNSSWRWIQPVVVSLCLYMVKITFLTYACDTTESEAAGTRVLLQKLYDLADHGAREKELKKFLEQTKNRKIRLFIGGFLPINRAFLMTIISSIATYLVILLQNGDTLTDWVKNLKTRSHNYTRHD